MAQIIENATDIQAVITKRSPDPSSDDRDQLTVEVQAATPVAGVADLLSSSLGGSIDVVVPRELLPDAAIEGALISARVAIAGPGVNMVRSDVPISVQAGPDTA